jgi:hypothetical protein
MKKSCTKTVLFALTAQLMFSFVIQKETKLLAFRPLEGVLEPAPKPELSFETCCTGEYQSQVEPYLKENIGFREPLIRFYNQFLYDFFRTSYSKEVFPGKDHWFYFRQHVNEYYGTEMYRWFPSAEEAREGYDREAQLMWKLRNILNEYGIEFLMFMAPDKGYLYPEHLPNRKMDTTSVNAREYYSRKFDEYGFPYIEMTKWFIDLKEADTLPYSLFSQSGAHWGFSAVLAADSVFRLMESLKGEQLPKLHIGPLRESSEATVHGDHDLEHTINLMRSVPHKYDRLYDAEVTVVCDSSTTRPSVLFVGNSFLWRMHYYIPFDDMFTHSEYWFYNSTAYYGKGYSQSCMVGDLDLLSKLLESDYVVWFTDGNQMYKVSYGFVESALLELCFSEEQVAERRERLMDSLSRDSLTLRRFGSHLSEDELVSQLWTRANELMLKDPERYFPELAGDSVPTARNPRIPASLVIRDIKKDTAWMKNLQCQTVIRNASLNQVLEMEAQNVLNNRPLMRDEQDVVSQKTYVESLVKAMEEQILNSPELLESIRQKAEANGISFEEQLHADAAWIVNYQIEQGLIEF